MRQHTERVCVSTEYFVSWHSDFRFALHDVLTQSTPFSGRFILSRPPSSLALALTLTFFLLSPTKISPSPSPYIEAHDNLRIDYQSLANYEESQRTHTRTQADCQRISSLLVLLALASRFG